MKAWLREAGETTLGLLWWGLVWAWGGFMSAAFILAPLLLANMAVLIREIPATVALAGGVAGAYVMNVPPWDAEEPESLPLVIGGAAVAVVIWDIARSSADVVTLLVALGLAAIGWPVRRFVSSARPRTN